MTLGCADARRLLLEREDARLEAGDAQALAVHLANCPSCRRAAAALAKAVADIGDWLAESGAVGPRPANRTRHGRNHLRGPSLGMAVAAAACLALMAPARLEEEGRSTNPLAEANAAVALSWLDAAADEPAWEIPEP